MVPACLLLLVVWGRGLAAQSDSTPGQCSAIPQSRPDSMVPVDTEATPDNLPAVAEGPKDAADQQWVDQLRRTLADATYHPARIRGCPVARWSTFAVWAKH